VKQIVGDVRVFRSQMRNTPFGQFHTRSGGMGH
jgi:hypothetical protein